jgi:hypothetical protein
MQLHSQKMSKLPGWLDSNRNSSTKMAKTVFFTSKLANEAMQLFFW